MTTDPQNWLYASLLCFGLGGTMFLLGLIMGFTEARNKDGDR